jgi:hypothetical protein
MFRRGKIADLKYAIVAAMIDVEMFPLKKIV